MRLRRLLGCCGCGHRDRGRGRSRRGPPWRPRWPRRCGSRLAARGQGRHAGQGGCRLLAAGAGHRRPALAGHLLLEPHPFDAGQGAWWGRRFHGPRRRGDRGHHRRRGRYDAGRHGGHARGTVGASAGAGAAGADGSRGATAGAGAAAGADGRSARVFAADIRARTRASSDAAATATRPFSVGTTMTDGVAPSRITSICSSAPRVARPIPRPRVEGRVRSRTPFGPSVVTRDSPPAGEVVSTINPETGQVEVVGLDRELQRPGTERDPRAGAEQGETDRDTDEHGRPAEEDGETPPTPPRPAGRVQPAGRAWCAHRAPGRSVWVESASAGTVMSLPRSPAMPEVSRPASASRDRSRTGRERRRSRSCAAGG